MKGKAIAENMELAYKTWRECGQNETETARRLMKTGFKLSRQTVIEWREKYSWKDRAARAEAVEQQATDPQLSSEERAIATLVREQGKYEEYFDTLPITSRDSQMTYAFNSLVTTIQSLRQKTAAYKAELFIDFMKDLVSWLQKNDPENVQAIEKNFDEFIQFAKEKYKR